jgi:hypothetical protein
MVMHENQRGTQILSMRHTQQIVLRGGSMAEDVYTSDEARKLAVFIARVWANPDLAAQYKRSPDAVLAGAGVELRGRPAPEIPERPSALGAQGTASMAATSSASSISTVTCPCSACSASSAGCLTGGEVLDLGLDRHIAAITKLSEDPAGREQARKLTSAWNVTIKS